MSTLKKKKIFGHIPYNKHIDILLFKMCCVELMFLQENSQTYIFKDVEARAL